jgi:hypothetical protein
MPEVADILRRYGRDDLDRFGEQLLPSHRRAMADLAHCRTEALGGHLLQCDNCGQEHYVHHSCRHRSCPKCHGHGTEAWVAERRQELLPAPCLHVVFTLPQERRQRVRQNQKDLYDILIRAAAQSRITLAADPHYVGGLSGVLCVCTPGPGPSPTIHTCTVWCQLVGSRLTTNSGGRLARRTSCLSGPSLKCSAVGSMPWYTRSAPP